MLLSQRSIALRGVRQLIYAYKEKRKMFSMRMRMRRLGTSLLKEEVSTLGVRDVISALDMTG